MSAISWHIFRHVSVLVVGVSSIAFSAGCSSEDPDVPAYPAPTFASDDLCQDIDGIQAFSDTTINGWRILSSAPGSMPDQIVNRIECQIEATSRNGAISISAGVKSYGGSTKAVAEDIASRKPVSLCEGEKEGQLDGGLCRVHFAEYLSTPRVQIVKHISGSSIVASVTVSSTSEADLHRVETSADELINVLGTVVVNP